jgi:immune inhibitor A
LSTLQQTETVSASSNPADTLHLLQNTLVPVNNLLDLAQRFEGKTNLPVSLDTPPPVLHAGDQQSFWINDSNTNKNFKIQAHLRYITDHVYFWIQDGVAYHSGNLKALAETFENKIYPTDREFFGSEWTPGVDNDPHLYILYAKGLGDVIAGYFSTADEYLPEVRPDSNGHEMFLISADIVDLGAGYAYSVLAHEFQHMIHWYRDRNEETWMNEGFSDLAAFLNGYSTGGHDYLYTQDPDIQLTDWPTSSNERPAHYGASFLFMTYFLDRLGEEATKAVVADPANGLESIDKVLAALQITDPASAQTMTADQVFGDWVVASYLQDATVGDGRYTYSNYPSAPNPSATEDLRQCPQGPGQRDVHQYGVDYVRILCKGDNTLHFEGSNFVNVLPEGAYSGVFAFYSNRGDESDMTLTRSFDFTGKTGPLTLDYWTWYDLEKDYDYLYLLASLDGKNWQILLTPSGTADNPSGNSYGWAYNGFSGNGPTWVQESIDLSQFAGKKVQLRFEYITDAAVNGEGFLVDDIAIPEIGYFTDFESDDGGWQADGFVRIQNTLPQFFRLSLISIGKNTTVTNIPLSADNIADIPLTIGGDVREVILVVSGMTRFTRQKAVYQLSIQP